VAVIDRLPQQVFQGRHRVAARLPAAGHLSRLIVGENIADLWRAKITASPE